MVKKVEFDERGAAPCKHCLKHKKLAYPIIVKQEGMFYARCSECRKEDPFEFLALSEKKAIAVWNRAMTTKSSTYFEV